MRTWLSRSMLKDAKAWKESELLFKYKDKDKSAHFRELRKQALLWARKT